MDMKMLRVDHSTKGRLRLVLNRPDSLNALHPDLLHALADAVNGVTVEDEHAIITLEGAGGRAFSAGYDLKVLAKMRGQGQLANEALDLATNALRHCPKPTLAIVDGYCLGAGLDLAMSCDFRVATTRSKFAIPAIKLGTVYSPRAIERIALILGSTITKELFVMGREFDAPSAFIAGIVQEVMAVDQLENSVLRWTTLPARGARASVAHKRIIDALMASHDRSAEFWLPLDALREESVRSSERRDAVDKFNRKSHGAEKN
jgi:enoyl-CoA hydratase/carnithine racemase